MIVPLASRWRSASFMKALQAGRRFDGISCIVGSYFFSLSAALLERQVGPRSSGTALLCVPSPHPFSTLWVARNPAHLRLHIGAPSDLCSQSAFLFGRCWSGRVLSNRRSSVHYSARLTAFRSWGAVPKVFGVLSMPCRTCVVVHACWCSGAHRGPDKGPHCRTLLFFAFRIFPEPLF